MVKISSQTAYFSSPPTAPRLTPIRMELLMSPLSLPLTPTVPFTPRKRFDATLITSEELEDHQIEISFSGTSENYPIFSYLLTETPKENSATTQATLTKD